MRVALVDPGRQVPDYDRALAGALAGAGSRVWLVTAPLLYYDPGPTQPELEVRIAFGRLLVSPWLHRLKPAERPTLRRALRALGYGPELACFLRWARRENPDIVHLQWSLAPLVDAAVMRRLRAMGRRVVQTAHNVLPHDERRWHAPSFRRLYYAADRVVVHSRAAAGRLAAIGVAPERVTVIPMPADEPDRVPTRPMARSALDLPPDVPLILFFGHVRPYKGLDVLLAATPELRRQVPGVRLLVAGPVAGGPRGAVALREAVGELGISDAVDLRPGYVPHESVADYFAAADVVALPYRAVDDSAVLAAARGHGRAVVASAVGGLPESLAAGGGLLVPPADPAALAEALTTVLTQAGTRDRLEAETRGAARAWTWADAADRQRELYAELLAEGR